MNSGSPYHYKLKGSAEVFFQTQVWNGGTTTLTRFNPFTETPVQGTHWELGPNFGKARNKNAYQVPRQIRFSVGVRF